MTMQAVASMIIVDNSYTNLLYITSVGQLYLASIYGAMQIQAETHGLYIPYIGQV